ncbi:type IV pilus modification PilV family protein [Sporosarcina psychrophila]|uniref:type IV pilus modification PilV family protein n=1 Tax=Sporosarcina psychrophila TaxID=1476 RepID=UPI00078CB6A0|nr:type II secretion system protein [Sporosarcina psychrophila]AMQ05970.1 hypothetical protein AZE41_08595 [Sporosarcina psychrophila]
MKRTHKKLNEAGMTLVEILAALVILGIVFIGFMTIFPQMTSFNEKTETKLETMNLARIELNSVRNKSLPTGFLDEIKKTPKNEIWTDKYTSDKYKVEVDYYTKPDLKPNDQKENDGQAILYRVDIRVFKDSKKISETFGYVKVVN